MKKLIFIIIIALFIGSYMVTFAETKNKQEPAETSFPNNKSKCKLDIKFEDYYLKYNGYIDEVAMFGNRYDNQDYDDDHLADRIYKNVYEVYENGKYTGIKSYYIIEFGNDEKLKIGEFNDPYTGIQIAGYDLTGDGKNEIVFLGKHEATTIPEGGSELAIYQKVDNKYEMMTLPRQDDWTGNLFEVGYSFYILKMINNKMTLYNPVTKYQDTIVVTDMSGMDFFKHFVGNYSPFGAPAWRLKLTKYNDKPALVIYNHIGSKFYDQDIATSLIWQEGVFIPVKMQLVPMIEVELK